MENKPINILKKLTKHNFIKLTSRGNAAIFAALCCAKKINSTKKIILVPDQGGWFTYIKYPKILRLDVKETKTEHGVIDLNELKLKSKNACAFIYSDPAGYFAEQPVKEIYNICKKNNCLVILDITGSIGKTSNNADFIVCSFGEWKPINLKYGGFISTNKKEYFDEEILKTASFNENYLGPLYKKLKNLKKRYTLFYEVNKKVKQDLNEFEIIHKNKKGLNVVIKINTEEEKEKIINYCKKYGFEYSLCPRYIRVNEKAISIEVKRLE